jgi:hypothetical protein
MPTADDIRWFKQQFRAQIDKQLPLDRVAALCVGDTIELQRARQGPAGLSANQGCACSQAERAIDVRNCT